MSWVRVKSGKLEPMSAEVTGFWSQAIQQGVRALGFSLHEAGGGQWMTAEVANDELPSAVRRAASAAIEVDKEVAHSNKSSQIVMARALLMAKLEESAAINELRDYQALLAVELLRRVAADPPTLLAALAEPYE
jgi:hypothetical protein